MTPSLTRPARVVLSLLLVAGGNIAPPVVSPVAAIDCSAVYCAWLEIVPGSGTGSGSVVSVPSGINCTWSGSRSGTCLYQFSWGHFVTGGIDVDLYLDADSNSYVCYGGECTGLGRGLVKQVHLNPGSDIDVFPVFNLGSKTHIEFAFSNDGKGRVTASLGGIDCRWNGSAKSGTCGFDVWWLSAPPTSVFSITQKPDADSITCSPVGTCQPPGEAYTFSTNITATNRTVTIPFFVAHSVAVAVSGSGTVVSNPAGISCPPTCDHWFSPTGGPIKLTGTPAAGWYVKDWTGGCTTVTSLSCSFSPGFEGAAIGVTFARLTEPPPSAGSTPRPSPRPSSAPPPTAAPASSAHPAGTTAPATSPVAPAPGSSTPSASESPPVQPETPDQASQPPSVAPASSADQGSQSIAPVPAGEPGAGAGGIDSTILILLGVIVVLALALGYALGGRRSPGATRPRA